MKESPTKSEVVEPLTEAEIAEYGAWLGLEADDSELMWIAKQALQTPIPSPWIECETEDSDVFYYNTVTRESVWDHPYDAYYKAAILRYKSGECSIIDLTELVSQPWLFSVTDERTTHQPELSPKFRVSISVPADDASPAGTKSPSKLRRRISERQLSISDSLRLRASPRGSPGSYSSRYISRDDAIDTAKLIADANAEIADLKASQLAAKVASDIVVADMTRDLLTAKEYIELLQGQNKELRSRMIEALTKAGLIRDRAQDDISILMNRIRLLEVAPPDQPLLARLCGCSAKEMVPKLPAFVPADTDSPYGEIKQLLMAPSQ